MTREIGDLFEHLIAAHPRIQERGLESRLVAVLNHAYAFEVARGLEIVDADAAQDSLEVLQAATELASMVTRLPESERPSGIWTVMDSLRPPPPTDDED
jgi:hypothetical protein